MTNTNATNDLFTTYRMNDATDVFAVAYTDMRKPADSYPVRVSLIPADDMGAYLTTSRKSSSHGGGLVLRFRPTNTYKVDMRNRYGAVTVCTYGELVETRDMLRDMAANGEIACKPSKLNMGHAVEYILCERWGLDWDLDDTSHAVKGDISLDGVEYQVKYQGASL